MRAFVLTRLAQVLQESAFDARRITIIAARTDALAVPMSCRSHMQDYAVQCNPEAKSSCESTTAGNSGAVSGCVCYPDAPVCFRYVRYCFPRWWWFNDDDAYRESLSGVSLQRKRTDYSIEMNAHAAYLRIDERTSAATRNGSRYSAWRPVGRGCDGARMMFTTAWTSATPATNRGLARHRVTHLPGGDCVMTILAY